MSPQPTQQAARMAALLVCSEHKSKVTAVTRSSAPPTSRKALAPLLSSGQELWVGLPHPSLQMDSLIHMCFSVVPLGTFRGMKQAFLGSCCQGHAKVEKKIPAGKAVNLISSRFKRRDFLIFGILCAVHRRSSMAAPLRCGSVPGDGEMFPCCPDTGDVQLLTGHTAVIFVHIEVIAQRLQLL